MYVNMFNVLSTDNQVGSLDALTSYNDLKLLVNHPHILYSYIRTLNNPEWLNNPNGSDHYDLEEEDFSSSSSSSSDNDDDDDDDDDDEYKPRRRKKQSDPSLLLTSFSDPSLSSSSSSSSSSSHQNNPNNPNNPDSLTLASSALRARFSWSLPIFNDPSLYNPSTPSSPSSPSNPAEEAALSGKMTVFASLLYQFALKGSALITLIILINIP